MLHICGLLPTVMALSFRTDRSGQTVQTQMRLFLEQSGQGLNYLRHFEFGKLLIYHLVGNSEHRYSKHRACWRRFSCFPISSTEAIPPLFGTPDSGLFRRYSVHRTLLRGTPTEVQMVRVRRILCSASKKNLKISGKMLSNG